MTKAFYEDDLVNDPDYDKIPVLPMQLRKSIDVGGNRDIIFQDGDKVKIPLRTINMFFDVYNGLKPIDREAMQNQASKSAMDFTDALIDFAQKDKMPRSIY